jgi:ketosteroid isomerase-like protein
MRPLAVLPALALAACAHSPPTMDVPASLAAAETAFAAHSVREDMRAAFLAHFDADGVLVRGGWMVSNDYLRAQPAPPVVLDWRPQYVEVAASGDLGLSTGPWKITSKAKPEAPPAYGQFVSVWRRQGNAPWKVAVDLGIQHPQAAGWDTPLQARMTPGIPGAASGAIAEAETRFARDAARDARDAYAAHGARDLRFYRTGYAPIAGRDAALASAAMEAKAVHHAVERIETASSGDFGYARGHYASLDAPARPLGWYLRVWRREAAGWRIVLDVTNPAH